MRQGGACGGAVVERVDVGGGLALRRLNLFRPVPRPPVCSVGLYKKCGVWGRCGVQEKCRYFMASAAYPWRTPG